MKNNRLNYILVGGFVLSVLAALVVSLALLTGRTGNVDIFYTVYGNVTGIKYGTQVLYEGYPVGQVETIRPFESKGQMLFEVEMSVISEWKIPEDSVARAAASGLLSAIAINISAGSSTQNLNPGDAIQGREADSLFGAISTVAGEIAELSNSIKPVLKTVDATVTTIGNVLRQDGAPLLRDLRRVTGKVEADLPVIISDVKATTQSMRNLLTDENGARIGGILRNLDTASANLATLSGDLRTTAKQLDQFIANADSLVANADGMIAENREDVAETIGDLRHATRSVARHIDAINENLEGASRNMYEFSRHIRQNPGLLLGGKPPTDDAK